MKYAMLAVLTLPLAACAMHSTAPSGAPGETTTSTHADLANPASTYCVQQGGRLDLRKDGAGNVGGVCVFKDGRACEEWALFRDHQCVAPNEATH